MLSKFLVGALACILAGVLSGCGIGVQPLMPTPVVYTESGFEPLQHIPEHERWIPRRVFYATSRERVPNAQEIAYGNTPSDQLRVGMAVVGFDGADMTWASLNDASTSADRGDEVTLSISGIVETGQFDPAAPSEASAAPEAAGFMLESMRDVIDDARDRDVLIYVHGAKVNFYNACVFAAQLDHFMGRDLTSVAFSWPTHQNILSYAGGGDIHRAYAAADALAAYIELIADHTNAERIHVLCWSAGARVTTAGLTRLRERHPGQSVESLRERFRLGTVYFAAGDVPAIEFLEHIEVMHGLADQLIVTQTDDDSALKASKMFIGGGVRLGQDSVALTPEQAELLGTLDRLEVVDVSIGSETRGFDITGHRFWFTHPWASSDVMLSIRTRLMPAARGLEQGNKPYLWYLPADYPARLRALLSGLDAEVLNRSAPAG
ncbi:MAG: alpha/beta hydrolase [Planctomycetota bacterium]